MDRRTLLAIALMLVAAILPTILFPPKRPVRPATAKADSMARDTARATERPVTPAPPPARAPASLTEAGPDTAGEQRVTVTAPLYRLVFSTRGARLAGAEPLAYHTFVKGERGPAQLVPPESEFLSYWLVVGTDTVSLAEWQFQPSVSELQVGSSGATLDWIAHRGAVAVRLRYQFVPQQYVFQVEGEVSGLGASGGLVLLGLGPRLRVVDADSVSDIRSYGIVTKARGTQNVTFGSLDPGERRELAGPFEWVAVKSKYFMAAVLTLEDSMPRFGGAVVVGGTRDTVAPGKASRYATRAHVTASLAAPSGRFAFGVYVGPQEYQRLARLGHDLEDINPYGWILRPVIRPFSILIVQILLWMHDAMNLAYGWVLVLFGIGVRILLWPLNQKAMRSSVAMQAIQPEIKALQDRYKNDPQKMQQELFKLYKQHGVNPLGGCLPMLIPMPVLFALFFVFANTIEFRGVPFLWLPDLSRADPLYIIPLVMGLSMFGLSKMQQQGMPPNPQTKMMLYIMPVMFTVLFLNFSSGLNLYYAVSNIASIPQQWLISRERLRRLGKTA
jgi:YidC/Oxa1 family membrane protein insertase